MQRTIADQSKEWVKVIETSSLNWQSSALTVVLHPHIKLPYSELHIGMPHMELNHLFQFTDRRGTPFLPVVFGHSKEGFSDRERCLRAYVHIRFYCLNAAIKASETCSAT